LLRWRIISATAILAVLLALLWLDYRQAIFHMPGAWLVPVMLLLSVLATEETLSLLRAKGHRPIAWIVYFGNVLLPLTASLPFLSKLDVNHSPTLPWLVPFQGPSVALALVVAIVLIGEMARFERPATAIENAALGVFAIVYVGLLIGFWASLRLHHNSNWGIAALFSMLLVTKMADTGAFAVGKCFGRHKLTPTLSPGKTWEGAFGGIATACVTSWAFFQFGCGAIVGSTYIVPPVAATLVYGVLLALAGMVGDLAESLLKRDSQRKDSSTWLPGLGGVLDIIDSLLVAGPVAWLCWSLGLLGP
jgi:phosphatidate cytidylyltransferase